MKLCLRITNYFLYTIVVINQNVKPAPTIFLLAYLQTKVSFISILLVCTLTHLSILVVAQNESDGFDNMLLSFRSISLGGIWI